MARKGQEEQRKLAGDLGRLWELVLAQPALTRVSKGLSSGRGWVYGQTCSCVPLWRWWVARPRCLLVLLASPDLCS